ncbi:MAG: hypothetical protein GX241_01765 [Ruminococcaceae bacterium]|nr:hypothetical protein [Oscillospiraceae bacterium]
MITMMLMMVCLMMCTIAILLMYTGRSATYDRSAKKMAKASKPKKSKE